MDTAERRWNVNIHHHRVVLDAVPEGAQVALDVGCGEGMLTLQLAERVPQVVGIDPDGPSIQAARRHPVEGVRFLEENVLTAELALGSFDFVGSVAALHHMDEAGALARFADLLRPGGVMAIIGIARPRMPHDLPTQLARFVATSSHRLVGTYWDHSAPMVWPPPTTYPEIRAVAETLLPGVRCRRHLLGRYSLVWSKPRPPVSG